MRLYLMLIPYAALGLLATCAPQPPQFGHRDVVPPCQNCAGIETATAPERVALNID